MKIEIDYFDANEHVQKNNDSLVVRLPIFPDGFVGKITQEFIEKDEEPGKFEEFVFKEIEEE